MYHRPLTAEQEDGVYHRILVPRARNKFGIALHGLPDNVHDWIVECTFDRIVRKGRWNLRRALVFFDNHMAAFIARQG